MYRTSEFWAGPTRTRISPLLFLNVLGFDRICFGRHVPFDLALPPFAVPICRMYLGTRFHLRSQAVDEMSARWVEAISQINFWVLHLKDAMVMKELHKIPTMIKPLLYKPDLFGSLQGRCWEARVQCWGTAYESCCVKALRSTEYNHVRNVRIVMFWGMKLMKPVKTS